MMKRWLLFSYGLLAYGSFLATIAYAMAFLGNLFVGRTIDAAATVPVADALGVNFALLVMFALQHSGMARPWFKRWLSRAIHPDAVRSTYVFISCAAMIVLMILWQPMGGVVWSIENVVMNRLIMAVYFFGWGLMFWSTFLLDHFEMFGLRQVWCHLRGEMYCREPAFDTPAAYRYVRHPGNTAWLIILWASPIMTVSHLVLAMGLTVYVLLGIQLEERDLEKRLPYYEQYRRKVPMLIPSLRKRLLSDAES